MIEKIIFNIIAIALLTITFLKFIKKRDVVYATILLVELIGIAINFVELALSSPFHWTLRLLMYLCSILLPAILLGLEKVKKADLAELFRAIIVTIDKKIGKVEEAKTILTNFLKKHPNSYLAHKMLAQIYEEQKNYEAAIAEYSKVQQINPKDMEASYQLANVLNKNKQNEHAVVILKDILKQTPENEKATNLLADIYFEQEQYQSAILVYMEALRYHPGNFDLYYNVAMAYTMLNDFKRAKEFYEKAAQINSLAYNAKLNLGQIALMYGDLEKAEKYFREAMKQEDLEAGCYYYLSQIAILKGDEERAKNYMNVAIQLDSNTYTLMQKDPIFIPIREKVTPPQEIKEEQKEQAITKKEQSINKHLSKMCILIGNLSSEELQKIREKAKKQKQTEQIKEQKQKE